LEIDWQTISEQQNAFTESAMYTQMVRDVERKDHTLYNDKGRS